MRQYEPKTDIFYKMHKMRTISLFPYCVVLTLRTRISTGEPLPKEVGGDAAIYAHKKRTFVRGLSRSNMEDPQSSQQTGGRWYWLYITLTRSPCILAENETPDDFFIRDVPDRTAAREV